MTKNASPPNALPPRKFKIHVGKYGGVRVDPKEFFADPVVQEKMKLMKETTLVGRKLDSNKQPAGESD